MSSMEVFYKPSPQITIKLETRGLEEMFQELGPIQEILSEKTCGKCGGHDIRMMHRKTKPDDNGKTHDVYELLCETPQKLQSGKTIPCGHKLQIGKDTDQKLFPKRYPTVKDGDRYVPVLDADGNKVYYPNNGWVRWDGRANGGSGGYV